MRENQVTVRVFRMCFSTCWAWLVTSIFLTAPSYGAAEDVIVGTYIKQIHELDFKTNKYKIEFFIWFIWKDTPNLKGFKPLESMEIVNGAAEGQSGIVRKQIGQTHYASARIVATILHPWELSRYPFDRHSVGIFIEDSELTSDKVRLLPDSGGSRLGDEISIAGWQASNFRSTSVEKPYQTTYGDPELAGAPKAIYSRYVFGFDMERQTFGSAVKLFSTVLLATAVAFVAFLVRPSDLDARFGMGVGALFAVAASSFIAASSVPDSGVMTVADLIHMVSLGFIFCSLLVSAICLKLEYAGRTELVVRIDRLCLMAFPGVFYVWSALVIHVAIHGGLW